MSLTEPRKTPLYEKHVAHGARIVDFAGWWLPVQYAGILEEHRAVREQAGLFDVSHMGEIRIKGSGALPLLQQLLTNNMASLDDGGVRYSPMCYATGGTVDDVLVYRLSEDEYWLVVNAANKDKDLAWILDNAAGFNATVMDESDQTAEVALQGPAAAAVLSAVGGDAVTKLGYYEFLPQATLAGLPVLISRTGYTGEDGFEIYCRPDAASRGLGCADGSRKG